MATNTADVSSTTYDPEPDNNIAHVRSTVAAVADVGIQKTASGLTGTAGGQMTYTLTVTNYGPSTARDVTVTDVLPAEVTYVLDTFGCGATALASGCAVGDLAVGASISFNVLVTVNANATSPDPTKVIANTATVEQQSIYVTDPNAGNDASTAEFQARSVADLKVLKFGKPDGTVRAGDPLTYTIIVENWGPSYAYAVNLVDELKSDGTFHVDSVSTDRAATCTPTLPQTAIMTAHVECALSNPLEPATSPNAGRWMITLTVHADDAVDLNDVATVKASSFDPQIENNTAIAQHEVTAVADLSVTKTATATGAGAPDFVAGETLRYTLSVSNGGPSTAENVVLIDTLPAGIVVTNVTPSVGSCTVTATQVVCGLGNLGVEASASVTIDANISAALDLGTILDNSAFVSSDVFDDDNANNYAHTLTEVYASADLVVNKRIVSDPYRIPDHSDRTQDQYLAGTYVVHDIYVQNVGPSDAHKVYVWDDIKNPQLHFISATVVTPTNGSCVFTTYRGTDSPLDRDTVWCEFPEIKSGQIAVVQVTSFIDPSWDTSVKMSNRGYAYSVVTPDPDVDNNEPDPVERFVVARADMQIEKTADSLTAVAGEEVTFTLTVTNHGESLATGIEVTDVMPAGMEYVLDTFGCGASLATGCALPDMLPGQSLSIKVLAKVLPNATAPDAEKVITNTASVTAEQEDPNLNNNRDSADVDVHSVADLRIVKFGKPEGTVRAGEELTYTIIVENWGPSYAYGTTLVDELVSDGTFDVLSFSTNRDNDISSCTATPAGSLPMEGISKTFTLVCQLGAPLEVIGPLDQGRWIAKMTVKANQAQDINNVASVRSYDMDPAIENNGAEVLHEVTAVADLALSKTAVGTPEATLFTAGQGVIYTLDVHNYGPSDAENTLVVDWIPAGVTVTNVSVSVGTGSCTVSGSKVECGLDTIVAGGDAQVTIRGTLSPDLPEGSILNNSACVSSGVFDDNNNNNCASVLNVVGTSADLGVSMYDYPDPVTAGELLEYHLFVTNYGPSQAQEVIATLNLPTEMVVQSMSILNSAGTCVLFPVPSQVVRCSLGTVAAGKTVEMEVVTRVREDAAPGTVTAYFSVTSTTNDPVMDNNVAEEETTIAAEADLAVYKTASTLTPVPGTDMSFQITVTNYGPSTAADVYVLDTLPAGLTYVLDTQGCGTSLFAAPGCSLGDMAAGDTVTFTVVVHVEADLTGQVINAVDVTTTTEDPNQANNHAAVTLQTRPVADVRIIKFGKPDGQVAAGEDLIYTIMIENYGPSYAHGVTLVDDLVSSGTFTVESLTSSRDASPCTTNLGPLPVEVDKHVTITCQLAGDLEPVGPLNAGRWQLKITVRANQPQDLNDIAVVKLNDLDPDESNNTAIVMHEITAVSNLEVTKVAEAVGPDAPDFVAGESLVYTLSVTNYGPSDALNTVLTDWMPTGVTLTSVQGANCTLDNGKVVTCGLGNIPATTPPTTVTVVLTGDISADLDLGAYLDNSAFVSSESYDNDNSNNYASTQSYVVALADLQVSKRVVSDPYIVGSLPDHSDDLYLAGTYVTHDIYVQNSGPSNAKKVYIWDDILNPMLHFVSATLVTPLEGKCSFTTYRGTDSPLPRDTIWCEVPGIAAGQIAVVQVVTFIDPSWDTSVDMVDRGYAYSTVTPDPDVDNNEPEPVVRGVVAAADLEVTKTADTLTPTAGRQMTFTLSVTNHGPSTARGVIVNDTLPSGFSYVLDTRGCGAALTTTGCNLGDMTPGTTVTLQMLVNIDAADMGVYTNSASVTSLTDEPVAPFAAKYANTDTADVDVKTIADLRVIKFGKPDGEVRAGDNLAYTILVENWGPSYAHNVQLLDEITSSGTFKVVSMNADVLGNRPGASCGSLNPVGDWIDYRDTVTCSLPEALEPVQPGTNVGRWLVEVVVEADQPQDIDNVARVSSTDFLDSDLTNNVAMVEHDITAVSDMSIRKEGPDTIVAGTMIEYILKIENFGPSDAENVVVVDNLPGGLMVTAVNADDGSCTVTDGTVKCVIGGLAANDYTTVVIDAMVSPDLLPGAVLSNTACITSDFFDDNNGNNCARLLTTVVASADLAVSMYDYPDPVTAGKTLEYHLFVSNGGPSLAQEVITTLNLPSEVEVESMTILNAPGTCVLFPVPSQVVRCSLGALEAGKMVEMEVVTHVKADATPGTVTAYFSVDSITPDPVLENNAVSEDTLIAASADMAIVKSASTLEPVAGETFKYYVTVTNYGPSLAENVVVHDTLDGRLEYVLNTDSCVAAGQTLTCTLGDLMPGASISYEILVKVKADATGQIVNTAVVTSDTEDPKTGNNTASVTVQVGTVTDLKVVKFGKPDGEVQAGETLTYTIIVENWGPSYAHNLTLADEITSSGTFTLLSATTDRGGSCTPTSGTYSQTATVLCSLDTLEPVTSPNAGRWIIKISVTAPQAQDIDDVAVAKDADFDPVIENNVALVEHDITAVADLEVLKSAEPLPGPEYIAGQSVRYTLTVTNYGPSDAPGVVVVDNIPAGVTVTSALVSGGSGSCEVKGGQVICGLDTLHSESPLNEGRTIVILGNLAEALPDGTILENAAFVSSEVYDDYNANNYATVLSRVGTAADVSIELSDYPDPVVAGTRLEYHMVVTNAGPSTAREVVATLDLPTGITVESTGIVNADGKCEVMPVAPQSVECTLGVMPSGKQLEIVVVTMVAPTLAEATVTATAYVGSTTYDPVMGNNSEDETTDVIRRADVAVVKTASTLTPVAGQNMKYTLTVTNYGPSIATDVVITDALPTGLTYVLDTHVCGMALATGCALGDMLPGQSVSFDVLVYVEADATGMLPKAVYSNTASVRTSTIDPNQANNTSTIEVQVQSVADLRVLKFGKPDGEVRAGDNLAYTILVENWGPSYAHSVQVLDEIASSGTFRVVSIDADVLGNREGATCTPAATDPATWYDYRHTITCSLPDTLEPVGAGTNVGRWMIEVVVEADQPQDINDVARVASVDLDPDASNNWAKVEHDITAVADLAITKQADKLTVDAGTQLVYTLTVTNSGPSDAENVQIRDILPGGLTVVSVTPSAGTCNVNNGTVVVCGLDTMPVDGTPVSIVIVTLVSPDVAEGSQLANSAFVASDVFDDNNANNYTTVITPVTTLADLATMIEDVPDPVVAGQLLEYHVYVMNGGPSAARDVISMIDLSSYVNVESATITNAGGMCTLFPVTPQAVECSLGTMEPGQTIHIVVVTRVKPETPAGTITSSTSVSSTTNDPDSENNYASTSTTVQAVADLEVTKSASTLTPTAGTEMTYFIKVVNHGPSYARDVEVKDVLPAGISYVLDTYPCGAVLTDATPTGCTLGDMAPGQEVNFTVLVKVAADATNPASTKVLDNVVTVSQDETIYDPQANNTFHLAVEAQSVTDLRVVKFGKPDGKVNAGEHLTYTMIVENLGPSYAHNVTLLDEMASDGAFQLLSVNANVLGNRGTASCSPTTGNSNNGRLTVNCTLGAALEPVGPAQNSGRWMVELVVTAPQPISLNNVATVKSSDVDPQPENNIAIVEHEITAVTDLSISKTAAPKPVTAGTQLTYTLTVTNAGPSTAENVVVKDYPPIGLAILSAVASQGSCSNDPGVVTCYLGNLLPGGQATITLVGMVSADLPDGYQLVNNAYVTSDTWDPNQGNNIATDITTVGGVADLAVNLWDYPDPVLAGTTLEYHFDVVNHGPSSARETWLKLMLSEWVEVQSVQLLNYQATCTLMPASPQEVDCYLGVMQPGQKVMGMVVVHVKEATPVSTITSTARVSSATFDSLMDNNTAPEETKVNTTAALSISKTADKLTVIAGEQLTYTLTVTNAGPSLARDVKVSDTLPAGTMYLLDTLGCGMSLTNCALGDILPGKSVSFQVVVKVLPGVDDGALLHNVASVSTTTPDMNLADNTTFVDVKVQRMADLRIIKFGKPDGEVQAGEELTYSIFVENLGPSYAHMAEVLDQITSSGKFQVISINPDVLENRGTAACTPVEDDLPTALAKRATVDCTVDELEPVGSGLNTGRWALEIVVVSNAAQDIDNVGVVKSANSDPDFNNNTATTEHEITAKADLAISKTGDTYATAGQMVNYTIEVNNLGPSTATNVLVLDQLPAEVRVTEAKIVKLVGGEPMVYGACVGSTGQLKCALGNLPAGDAGDRWIYIKAKIASGLEDGYQIENGAFITNDAFDPDNSNNYASWRTAINRGADVMVSVVDLPDPVGVLDEMEYHIRVTNLGPSDATYVKLSAYLPTNLRVGSTTSTQGTCALPFRTGDLQTINCELGTIARGANVDLTIHSKLAWSLSYTINSRFDVSATEMDPLSTNNSAYVTTNVHDPLSYFNDFEYEVGPEWSAQQWTGAMTRVTPTGNPFLGEFGNNVAKLDLTNLADHKWVIVTFDLYIIRSWDGNTTSTADPKYCPLVNCPATTGSVVVGPDFWYSTADGKQMLFTTFTNWADFRQSFPQNYKADHDPRTMSTGKNTLGYKFPNQADGVPLDATYTVTFMIRHDGSSINLDFAAMGLQDLSDESWGIDNVAVYLADENVFLPMVPDNYK